MSGSAAKDSPLLFRAQVITRASRSEIVGEHNGALRVRVAAAPVDGEANEELVRVLARALGVGRRAIEIVNGRSSRNKLVRVLGVTPATLAGLMVQTPKQ